MKQWIFIALVLATNTFAATVTANSASRADVGSAYTLCSDGDTLVIPAGTASWSSGLTVTKAITVQGAGIGQTILKDDILGENPQGLFTVTLVANQTTRITGIEFNAGTRTYNSFDGVIKVTGSNQDNRRFRLDHCKFDNLYSWVANTFDTLGVIDNNVINYNVPAGCVYVRHSGWDGYNYGDGSWYGNDNFGTENFLFIEDNTITMTLTDRHLTMIDGYAGARYVFRHNTVTRGSLEIHGTESGQRQRGGRAFEVYGNTFTGNDTGQIVTYFRSGTGVIYDNTISGYAGSNNPFKLLNERNENAYTPFSTGSTENAGADGKNPWDINEPGGPFETGAVDGADTGTSQYRTITVTGAGWSATGSGEWAGYSISRTSGKAVTSITRSGSTATVSCPGHGFSTGQIITIIGATQTQYNASTAITVTDANTFTYELFYGASPDTPATGTIKAFRGYAFSEVVSNTADTLTYIAASQGSEYFLRFEAADTFALWKVNHAMDQPGRVKGSLVTGDSPTLPSGWNDQETSPWYEWNNTREGGADVDFGAVHATIRAGEHYINDTEKPGYSAYAYPHPLIAATEGGGSSIPRHSRPGGTNAIIRRR